MKFSRILRIAGVHYQKPMQQIYAQFSEAKEFSYEQQLGLFSDNSFCYSFGFSVEMKKLGYEAFEILYDVEYLQKTWAREHGATYNLNTWQHDIILAQISALKPDIVYLQNTFSLPYSIRSRLKSQFPFIRMIIEYKGYPHGFDELEHVDIVLAGTPGILHPFQQAGFKQSYLMYHSFDAGLLSRLPPDISKQHDFIFSGSSGFGYGPGHKSRFQMLCELIERTGIELWIDDSAAALPDFRAFSLPNTLRELETLNEALVLLPELSSGTPEQVANLVAEFQCYSEKSAKAIGTQPFDHAGNPAAPLSHCYPLRCNQPLFGLEMYKLIASAGVVLNRHTDAAVGYVGNMRMYEVTGVGSCLLTDNGINMIDLFEPDVEVVVYNSTEECIEKALYLCEHEDERAKIAQAGHKKTLQCHTIGNRCLFVDELIRDHSKKRSR